MTPLQQAVAELKVEVARALRLDRFVAWLTRHLPDT